MLKVSEGMLQHERVNKNRYPGLEHGPMSIVHGIILHQTNCFLTFPTLLAYYWRDNGAHFLIAPDGTIYQTARMDRQCHHVGMLKSRCRETLTCTPAESKKIKQIWADSPDSEYQRRWNLHRHESKKSHTNRFPDNTDSIGIEIVGGTSASRVYQAPSSAQQSASRWLIEELLVTLGLQKTSIYRHPQVSYKNESEARSVVYE
jgi:N-acetyl-anhydromuramyl-L-alanine amidase AmpD